MGERPICSISGCGRVHSSGGLCFPHKWRRKHGYPMDRPIEARKKVDADALCEVPGCVAKPGSRGHRMCAAHQWRRIRALKLGLTESYWKAPINRRHPDQTRLDAWVPDARLKALKRYAENRGLKVGDALVELAVRHLDFRSAREMEEREEHADAWQRADVGGLEEAG